MVWTLLILSRNEGSGWSHIEQTSYLRILASLSYESIEIQLKYFGEGEIAELLLLESVENVQQKYSSVGIVVENRRIQIKLLNAEAALHMYTRIVYVQGIRRLRKGLAEITEKYKLVNKTV